MEELQMPNNKFYFILTLACIALTGCQTADMKTAKRAEAAGDMETARRHYAELAHYGIYDAQVKMAELTLAGNPTPDQAAPAIAMLAKAAETNASAAAKLGDIYDKGTGVPRDPKLAYQYYVKSYDLGSTKASYKIGSVLSQTPANHLEAKQWLLKALPEEPKAATKLARLYEKGNLPDRNLGTAYGYFLYAQDQGVAEASDAIAKLKPKLSAQSVSDGESFFQQLKTGVTL